MSKRWWLAIIAVLGIVAAIYLLLGDLDDASQPSARTPGVRDGASAPEITEADRGTAARTPSLAAEAERPAATAPRTAHEYEIGGVKVRDHRPGEQRPMDIPPSIHPPNGPRIAPSLTAAFAATLRQSIARCAADVPAAARGARPRLDGQITISIVSELATVTAAIFQPRDLEEPARAAVRQCMEQSAVGATAAAPGESDITGYTLMLRLDVR